MARPQKTHEAKCQECGYWLDVRSMTNGLCCSCEGHRYAATLEGFAAKYIYDAASGDGLNPYSVEEVRALFAHYTDRVADQFGEADRSFDAFSRFMDALISEYIESHAA